MIIHYTLLTLVIHYVDMRVISQEWGFTCGKDKVHEVVPLVPCDGLIGRTALR